MEKLRNKNTIVLIISALLILTAVIVAVVATASANNDKKEAEKTTTEEAVSLDLEAIANMNSSNKDKGDKNKNDKKTESDSDDSTTEPTTDKATVKPVTNNTSSYATGTYKVATQEDPLGMRLQPNAEADRILYIDKGAEVEVLAVWDDWGYVVHNNTGGWLSMSYLELVSGN